ncbi:threonine aldolase family protein [Nonomuraea sp. M3C6]|uniref:Threonine aldolase family protein n=1 Tax=Nonomuraea marmarensis TaxID=3351344 RepID=A0ABW7ARB8_9ACTN
MNLPEVPRSLFLHAPIRRKPADVLRRMAELVDDDTLPGAPQAALERRLAELLGKEAALLFPTGTMAQQVALRVHAARRARSAFAAHPQTHLDVWEEQGYAVVHGLRLHRAGDRNELMTRADLEAIAEPLAAVVWELPQRDLGGLLPEWDDLRAQIDLARDRGAAAHLDGARLWEAQTYYRRPFHEIAGLFDSVYVSLYKALQGLSGGVLLGDAETVAEAGVWLARLGGRALEPWPQALAALAGLDTLLPRMADFREHAIAIAAAINADGLAYAYPDPPQTPMFHVHLPAGRAAVAAAGAAMLADQGIQLFPRVRSAPDPRRSSFEVTVGENAMEFTPDEVAGLVRELVRRSRAGAEGEDLEVGGGRAGE